MTPDCFAFTIDRRINPEEDLEEETRRLHDTLEGFEIETPQLEPAAATSAEDPLGRILWRHILSISLGKKLLSRCVRGCTA